MSDADKIVYGIDVGMSTSLIAVSLPGGAVEVVRLFDDDVAAPTSICVRPDGETSVGRNADADRLKWPHRYLRQFKRSFAGYPALFRLDEPTGIHDVQAAMGGVIRFLLDEAQDRYSGRPARVAFAIPQGWGPAVRARMVGAAEHAGLRHDQIMLVSEALSATEGAKAQHDLGRHTLVYDLGGETFDCALTRIDGDGRTDVLKTGEIFDVGGVGFDHAILELLQRQFPAEVKTLFEDETRRVDQHALLDRCRRLKHTLSETGTATDRLPQLNGRPYFTVTRDEFERAIFAQVSRTIEQCDELLGATRCSWADLGAVLLVGGSSQIPLIERELSRTAPGRLIAVDRPVEAVVRGAAMLARQEADREPVVVPVQPKPPAQETVDLGAAQPPVRPRWTGADVPNPPTSADSAPRMRVMLTAWLCIGLGCAALRLSWPAALAAIGGGVPAWAALQVSAGRTGSSGMALRVMLRLAGATVPVATLSVLAWCLITGYSWPTAVVGTLWGVASLWVPVEAARVATALTSAAEDKRARARWYRFVRETAGKSPYFGAAGPLPQMFRFLRDQPCVKIFRLRTEAYVFTYAVVSGDRLLLVYVSQAGGDASHLKSAAAKVCDRIVPVAGPIRAIPVVMHLTGEKPVGWQSDDDISEIADDQLGEFVRQRFAGIDEIRVPLLAVLMALTKDDADRQGARLRPAHPQSVTPRGAAPSRS